MSTETKTNTETKTAKPGKGTVGPVRLSYLSVFKPRANGLKNGELEFSVTLLVPKADNEFCPDFKSVGQKINELIKAALEEKFGANVPKWDNPFRDGDKETDNEGNPRNPGYWFLNCSAKAEYPPLLIDAFKAPVTGGWQSGDWGKVNVQCYGYEHQGKRGVGVGLRGVQFLKHDEPLGGGGGASTDDFDTEAGDPGHEAEVADPFAE